MAAKYGKSVDGNFFVVDTIGVPHPYCITPSHITFAAERFSGLLSKEAIIAAESYGAKCDICKGKFRYDQHEQALLVLCKLEIREQKEGSELHVYLQSIADKARVDGYIGFAFVRE